MALTAMALRRRVPQRKRSGKFHRDEHQPRCPRREQHGDARQHAIEPGVGIRAGGESKRGGREQPAADPVHDERTASIQIQQAEHSSGHERAVRRTAARSEATGLMPGMVRSESAACATEGNRKENAEQYVVELIQHQVDDDAGDRDIQPEGQRPACDPDVPVELRPQPARGGHQRQRHDDRRQHDVREEDCEVDATNRARFRRKGREPVCSDR